MLRLLFPPNAVRSLAVFHWELLEQANPLKFKYEAKSRILERGQDGGDGRETLLFWINQVIYAVIYEVIYAV